MSVIVFLSAVSSEFQHHDPKRPLDFQPYRDVLARALRRMGSNYNLIVQEDLAQGFGDLLKTLDEEVSRSSLIVHLVGNVSGWNPEPACVRRLYERHPNLLSHEPELASALKDASDISYTQWEIYLGFHHRSRRLIFVADEQTPRSLGCDCSQMDASQARHLQRLEQTGEHREGIADQRDLALKVVTSVARYGLGLDTVAARPEATAVEAASQDPSELVQAIAEKIRNPDVKYVADADDLGVERFLQAVDTAAMQRELDRRSALEIVHAHRETLLDAVATAPTAANLQELAFAELSVGHYHNAIDAARQCAELAERQLEAASANIEQQRETALNAYLLWHDAATMVHRRPEAIAALERGCELIDQEHDPILWADYQEQLAKYLIEQAQFERAEELIDVITDIREDLQPDTSVLANSLLLWSRLLYQQANFQGAIDVCQRAESIFAGQTPPVMNGIASAMYNRAQALRATNRLAEAEPLVRRALAIGEQSYGDQHPNVATALNNLAGLLQDTNRLAEAEPLMRRALAIDEQSYGDQHPNVATALNNLAGLLQDTNRLAEAEPLMRRALAIGEQSYGDQHPNVARGLNNLAALLQATNRLAEAEPLMRRALAIGEQSYGDQHPNVATALNNLAGLLQDTNRLAEAEPLMRRALAIDEQSYGAEHPRVAIDLNNLAGLLQATNRLAEAEPLMRRAQEIFRDFLGKDHPSVQTAERNYDALRTLLSE